VPAPTLPAGVGPRLAPPPVTRPNLRPRTAERMAADGSPEPWERLSTRRVARYSIFDVRHDRVRSPRDHTEHDFHVAESPDGVTVLAFTPEGEIVLVEQFRAARRHVTLETPSGLLDEGEDPLAAGLRELREETGYVPASARIIGTMTLNPSWQTARVTVVLAEGAEPVAEKELDAGEDTRVRTVPYERLHELIREGALHAAVPLAALHLLEGERRSAG
jgi:ADP-ribose pyrophosphatase